MIQSRARRIALALVLGVSSVATVSVARAQTTSPTGGMTTNGVTGTDPVPPGCGCHVTSGTTTPSATTTSTTTTSSSTAAAAQALLVLLGLA